MLWISNLRKHFGELPIFENFDLPFVCDGFGGFGMLHFMRFGVLEDPAPVIPTLDNCQCNL